MLRWPLRPCLGLVVTGLLGIAATSTPAGAQQLFKSVGPDGRVTYSDRPPTDGRVEKTLKLAPQPSSSLSPQSQSYVEQLKRLRAAAPPTAAPPGQTLLYSASWCGYCRQAKAFMASRGLAYREIDIDSESGLAAFAAAGGGGIPLLVQGERRLQGFSARSYEAFFAPR